MRRTRVRFHHHLLSAVTVLALATALSGCWFQIGFNGGNTRFNPSERTLTPDTVGGMHVVWERSGPDSEATVAAGRVFVADDGSQASSVDAYDLADGDLLWSTELVRMENPFNSTTSVTPVTVEGDHLVSGLLGIDMRTLECRAGAAQLDPATGAVTGWSDPWFFPSETATANGVAARTLMSTGECNGAYEAYSVDVSVDRAGGPATRWTTARSVAHLTPAVAGDHVFVLNGSSVAAYTATGCGTPVCPPVWSTDLTGPSDDVVAGTTGPVYVTSDEHVVALDRATGDELWRGDLGGTGRGFALAHGTIFATVEREGSPARLVAFPAGGCGDPVCAPTRTSTLEGTGTGDPAVAGGVVYTSTDTTVQGFDASGCGAATCPALVTVPVARGGAVSASDGHVLVSGQGWLTVLALG